MGKAIDLISGFAIELAAARKIRDLGPYGNPNGGHLA
jgi:hypothetical protein